MGLLDIGFTDFIRVGSLRRIAKPVLKYSLHREGVRFKKDDEAEEQGAIKELQVSLFSIIFS